ncbi:MAG TPA: hypothetical protein VJA85_09455 [Candidatus Limnocylindria bacterium]|nr:hypothetical protein [Candidatus Limnocylindria bacterium]
MSTPAGRLAVYLEVTPRRTFASAVDWPGWSRSGKTEAAAIEALLTSAPRYARVTARTPGGQGLRIPASGFQVEVVARLSGNATTDFGAPAQPAPTDEGPISAVELEHLQTILISAWRAFDAAAAAAGTRPLRKGPRGGGRETAAIVDHVREAEAAYLVKVGGSARGLADAADPMAEVRHRALEALRARARGTGAVGEDADPRRWSARYFVRRSAWHALDHAWEIEDRVAT